MYFFLLKAALANLFCKKIIEGSTYQLIKLKILSNDT